MKSIDHLAERSVLDYSKDFLSNEEKKKFRTEILTMSIALVCLGAGALYGSLFPGQDVVNALIYIAGILTIGIPIVLEAVNGLISKNIEATLEILVAIAIVICTLDRQYLVAILIPVILTLAHLLEERSVMGGREAIDRLKKMQADTAILLKNGKETEVDAKELKCGDIIIIKPGMSLPVDGEVVFGISSMDQKSLTGESLPKTVMVKDQVFAGTFNIDGNIQVKVTKEYSDTSFQKIVKLLEDAEQITIPETKIVDKFMAYYIPLTLTIALLVWLFTRDITRAVAILVASCPCGLMLVSSAPMIAVLSNATRKGILIKNSAFIEHLPEVEYVIFDKTGTVTSGDLEAGSYHLDAAADFDELITTAASVAHASLHPISQSIVALCKDKDFEKGFEAKEHIGKGVEGKKGGDTVYLGSYSWIRSLGYQVTDKYENDENAGICDWVVKNGKVLGCVLFKDTPREDAAQVMSSLKNLGVRKTCLLTGDRYSAARKIQSDVGIDNMECELLPEEKLAHVEKAMAEHTVAVVGDGINDALALSKAHVGIAMGAMGSDTAIQSADIALMNNNLSNIPYAIKLAQKTKGIIYQNIIAGFVISLTMMFLAAIGFITPLFAAFFHNIGTFVVLINSGRLISGKELQ